MMMMMMMMMVVVMVMVMVMVMRIARAREVSLLRHQLALLTFSRIDTGTPRQVSGALLLHYEPVTTAYEMETVWVPTAVDAVTGEMVDLGALPPDTYTANALFSHDTQSARVPAKYPAPTAN